MEDDSDGAGEDEGGADFWMPDNIGSDGESSGSGDGGNDNDDEDGSSDVSGGDRDGMDVSDGREDELDAASLLTAAVRKGKGKPKKTAAPAATANCNVDKKGKENGASESSSKSPMGRDNGVGKKQKKSDKAGGKDGSCGVVKSGMAALSRASAKKKGDKKASSARNAQAPAAPEAALVSGVKRVAAKAPQKRHGKKAHN
ncbi:unnamed protein product [Phaeothamnion confervicola]